MYGKTVLNVKTISLYYSTEWGGEGTAFNNISVISQQSVLLVEETGVPGENP